jgi:hypothetical protein
MAVAADSSNGIMRFCRPVFVNSDLSINLLRHDEWIYLDARTLPLNHGGGLAESSCRATGRLVGGRRRWRCWQAGVVKRRTNAQRHH